MRYDEIKMLNTRLNAIEELINHKSYTNESSDVSSEEQEEELDDEVGDIMPDSAGGFLNFANKAIIGDDAEFERDDDEEYDNLEDKNALNRRVSSFKESTSKDSPLHKAQDTKMVHLNSDVKAVNKNEKLSLELKKIPKETSSGGSAKNIQTISSQNDDKNHIDLTKFNSNDSKGLNKTEEFNIKQGQISDRSHHVIHE